MERQIFCIKLKLLFMVIVIPFFVVSCIPKFLADPDVPAPPTKKIFITDIGIETEGQNSILTLYSSQMINYTSISQKEPPAIILEFLDVFLHRDLKPVDLSEGPIRKVIPEQISSEEKIMSRFTILMNGPFPHEINREENQLKIVITGVDVPGAMAEKEEIPAEETKIPSTDDENLTEEAKIPTMDESKTTPSPAPEVSEKEILRSVSITEPVTKDVLKPVTPIKHEKEEKIVEKESKELTSFFAQKRYTGKPISLDFQNADIRSVLRIIADVSGHNLVINPEVKGTVNISLIKPVPWDQALDVILKTNKLDMKMEGDIIRVGLPQTFAKETERELEAIQTQRKALVDEKKAIPLETKIVRINYAKASDLTGKLEKILTKGEGLAEPPSIMVDERTNTLIIKDLPETLEEIMNVINTLDRQTPQVLISARIVETNKNFAKDLGIQWGGTFSKDTKYRFANTVDIKGTTGTDNYLVNLPIDAGAFGAIGINLGHINEKTSLDIQLKAMESSGKGKIISNPKIETLDNEEATIKSGTKIPYQTTDKEGNPSTSFVDAAINLTVTPQITPDKNIIMKIKADKSEPNWERQVNGAPAITTRTATTRLIVKDGETAVIGGIHQGNEGSNIKKVPFFGDIPGLGLIFQTKDKTQGFDELLIFITPRIIETETITAVGTDDKTDERQNITIPIN